MGKKSKAPDVRGAAIAEGEMQRETARDVTYADRPDQFNPFGSVTWDQESIRDPATGEWTTKWTQNQQYDPAVMGVLNNSMGVVGQRAELANMLQDRVAAEMGAEPDWAQFGDVIPLDYSPDQIRQRAEDAFYQKEAARLTPQFDKKRADLEIKMRNQGLRPGDQAWDSQMAALGTQETDAFEQARLGSVAGGFQEAGQLFNQQMQSAEMANQLRNQQIQEYLGKREFSLGEADRLMEGQTVSDIAALMGG